MAYYTDTVFTNDLKRGIFLGAQCHNYTTVKNKLNFVKSYKTLLWLE